MSLVIHKEAQERLNLLAKKLHYVGRDEDYHKLLSLIMAHALRDEVIDNGIAYPPQGHGCEGEAATKDLLIFPDNWNKTDFSWVIMNKDGSRNYGPGGFNCHTGWFRDYVADKIKAVDLWCMKEVQDDREIKWSSNS